MIVVMRRRLQNISPEESGSAYQSCMKMAEAAHKKDPSKTVAQHIPAMNLFVARTSASAMSQNPIRRLQRRGPSLGKRTAIASSCKWPRNSEQRTRFFQRRKLLSELWQTILKSRNARGRNVTADGALSFAARRARHDWHSRGGDGCK